jgi:hypothetical protein
MPWKIKKSVVEIKSVKMKVQAYEIHVTSQSCSKAIKLCERFRNYLYVYTFTLHKFLKSSKRKINNDDDDVNI